MRQCTTRMRRAPGARDESLEQPSGRPPVSGKLRVEGSTTRLFALGALLATLLLPVAAWANAVSQALYTKGLIPFAAEHWNEAYKLFDEAVAADPNDPLAAYYRGLTAGRLGFPDVAKKEIERALRLWPALPGAALDLGIVYFDSQQYPQAEKWLHQAYGQPNDRLPAALFLGISRYRQGDDAGAAKYLAEAARDPQLRPTAQYYSGLVAVRQNRTADATQLFGDVRAAKPSTEIGQVANEYLTTGTTTAPAPAAPAPVVAAPSKPWGVYAGGAFEYDSNVILESTEHEVQPLDGFDSASDGRFVINAGGYYRFLEQPRANVSLSYDLAQSVHFNLREYDLQTHRLRGDFSGRAGTIGYGVASWYQFALLDYEGFVQHGVGMPYVTFYEGRLAATQVFYRILGKDYLEGPSDPLLDGVNNAVGVRQHFLLGATDRTISFGYTFDSEDTFSKVSGGPDDEFSYTGHQLDFLLSSGIAGWVNASLGYLLHYMEYADPSSFNRSGFHRRDTVHQVLAELERPIIPGLSARFWYIGTFDDSNTDEFRYDRHVVHLGVMYAF